METVLCMACLALSVSAALRTQTPSPQLLGCASDAQPTSAARAAAAHMIESGHVQQAVDTLKRLFDSCPMNPEVAGALAEAETDAGDPAKAERLLREMLKKQDLAALHSALGKTLAIENRSRDAAGEFQIVAKREPTEPHIFDFGAALMKIDFSAAQQILDYGIRTFPSSVRMHVALAVALYAQDRDEDGARLLCAASDLDPADVHPMEVLADTGDVPKTVQKDAVLRLDYLRRRHPEDGLLLFDYAMVKSGRWSGDKTADPPDLVPLLDKALRLNPTLPKGYFELALILDQQGDHTAEIAALQQAVALDPKSEQFHYRLAFAYRSIGNLEGYKLELSRYASLHSASRPTH